MWGVTEAAGQVTGKEPNPSQPPLSSTVPPRGHLCEQAQRLLLPLHHGLPGPTLRGKDPSQLCGQVSRAQRPLEGGREPSPLFLSISSGAPCRLSSHIPHAFTLPSLLLPRLPSGCLPPHHTLPPLVALAFLLLCPLSFLSSPCRNRATCQDGPQGPRCLCPPGYTGGSCQVRGTEPGVLRREGQESSSERASGIKRWQQGSLGEVST